MVLLHVVDVRVEEALHGAYGGLLDPLPAGAAPCDGAGLSLFLPVWYENEVRVNRYTKLIRSSANPVKC